MQVNIAHIEAYLEGKLPANEHAQFQLEINQNKELAAEVKAIEVANAILTEGVDMQLRNEIASIISHEKQVIRSNKTYKWTIVATAILASISAFYLFVQKQNTTSTEPKKEQKASSKQELSNAISVDSFDNETEKKPLITNSSKSILNKTNFSVPEKQVLESTPLSIENNRLKKETEKKAQTEFLVKSEQPNAEVKPVDCALFSLKTNPQILASCIESATGQVSFLRANFSNGTAPFLYSIDNQKSWKESGVFQDLPAGTHTFWIKDANECTTQSTANITSHVCQKLEYTFQPSMGEKFTFTPTVSQKYVLKISNQNSVLVFETNAIADEQVSWDGYSQKERSIHPGLYAIEISYENGLVQKGFVTILE